MYDIDYFIVCRVSVSFCVKMSWFITDVSHFLDNENLLNIVIHGFNTNVKDQCLKSIIKKTTLEKALTYEHNFNEHYSISVINPNEVYTITILFMDHRNTYIDMKEMPSESINKNRYFNGPYYMGLPMVVFAQWRGTVLVT